MWGEYPPRKRLNMKNDDDDLIFGHWHDDEEDSLERAKQECDNVSVIITSVIILAAIILVGIGVLFSWLVL